MIQITKDTFLQKWFHVKSKSLNTEDIRNIVHQELNRIYKRGYWYKNNDNELILVTQEYEHHVYNVYVPTYPVHKNGQFNYNIQLTHRRTFNS